MKIFIKTYGCQSNIADSEQIAGILEKNGYEIVDDLESSDIVVLNSCGIKLRTQNKELGFIKNLPKNKRLFVGGCLPKIINLKKYVGNIEAIFDTNSILKVPDIINKPRDILSEKKEKRINIPRIRKNKDIAILNIAQGCVGNCDYCAARIARGRLRSYKIKEIKKEVKTALKQGCKRIYLTSQDNGCYGFDIGTNIVNLLNELIKIKSNFVIRIGMMNPAYILSFLDNLVEIYKSPKIMKFLHIPVQSGSNSLLKKMGRKYTIKNFKKIVKKFRKNIPNITISTDIITGHPLEQERNFQETIKLIKEIKPDVLNLSKFAPRPRTKAALLKQLPSQEIKRRSVILSKIYGDLR